MPITQGAIYILRLPVFGRGRGVGGGGEGINPAAGSSLKPPAASRRRRPGSGGEGGGGGHISHSKWTTHCVCCEGGGV